MEMLLDIMLRKVKALKSESEEYDAPLTVLTRKEFRSYACNVLGASEKELPKPWMEEKQAGEEEKGRR